MRTVFFLVGVLRVVFFPAAVRTFLLAFLAAFLAVLLDLVRALCICPGHRVRRLRGKGRGRRAGVNVSADRERGAHA